MAKNDELERQKFEAWLKLVYIKQGLNHQYLWAYDEEQLRYTYRTSQVRWEAWQARAKQDIPTPKFDIIGVADDVLLDKYNRHFKDSNHD